MTRGLPSSPRTTLLTGAASLIVPTYLEVEKGGNCCVSSHHSNRKTTTEDTLFLILNPIMLVGGGGVITDTQMGIKAKLRPGFPLAAMTFQCSVFAPVRGETLETVILRLIPKLLEDRRVVIDVAHLDGDSGAGLHPGHAQSTHHQKVGRGLLWKRIKNHPFPEL